MIWKYTRKLSYLCRSSIHFTEIGDRMAAMCKLLSSSSVILAVSVYMYWFVLLIVEKYM